MTAREIIDANRYMTLATAERWVLGGGSVRVRDVEGEQEQ
jgi:hypothetical protein